MKKRGEPFHLWTKTRSLRYSDIGPYPSGRSSVPPLFSNARVVEPIGSSIWEMWRNTITSRLGRG